MATDTATIARTRLALALAADRAVAVQPAPLAGQVRARAHEATRPGRQRRLEPDWGSGNRIVGMDAKQLRDSARALCRDYDVAANGLAVLV